MNVVGAVRGLDDGVCKAVGGRLSFQFLQPLGFVLMLAVSHFEQIMIY